MSASRHIFGDQDRLNAIEAGVVNAVNYGTMRSGTSLVFTILCEWFPRNTIVKTHSILTFPDPHNPPVVVSYRDFRDAAVSAWRRHVTPDEMITEEELRHFAVGSHYNAFVLDEYLEKHPDSLFLRYEDDILNIPQLIRKLADYLSVQVADEEIQSLAVRHSIDQHRKEADGIAPKSPDAPWMESHIHDGAVECWKRFTPKPLQPLFTKLLHDELTQWGYSTKAI